MIFQKSSCLPGSLERPFRCLYRFIEEKDIFSSSSFFSPRTLWLLSLAPASVLYTTFLYAVVLLFLGITYMAQLQVLKGNLFWGDNFSGDGAASWSWCGPHRHRGLELHQRFSSVSNVNKQWEETNYLWHLRLNLEILVFGGSSQYKYNGQGAKGFNNKTVKQMLCLWSVLSWL